MRQYDVTWSLGDGLRPGSIADASDEAQFAELKVMGELGRRARQRDCQVMIEGPGHVPMDQIERNVRLRARVVRRGAVLRARARGDRHRARLRPHHQRHRGGAWPPGTGRPCSATSRPRSTWACPNSTTCGKGVIAYKIAAHAADLARHRIGARERDDALSRARFAFDWTEQFRLSLDPETAQRMHDESLPDEDAQESHYCSMCGPKFCSMKTTEELRQMQGTGARGQEPGVRSQGSGSRDDR